MGKYISKLLPWYVFDSTGGDQDTTDEEGDKVDDEEEEEYLDVFNEDDRLRGCKVGKRVIPVGACWTDPKTCTYYQCKDFNRLSSITCPESPYESVYRRCKEIPGDPEKDFPDCCAKVECEPPKFNSIDELEELGDLCDDPRNCL